MRQKIVMIGMVIFLVVTKSVPSSFSEQAFFASADSEQFQKGIIFTGLTESGITMNSFLSNEDMAPVPDAIKKYYNFDISGGRTIQLYNAFLYWLKQKMQAVQALMAQNPTTYPDPVADFIGAEKDLNVTTEWGVVNAFSLIITTNPILQATYSALIDSTGEQYQVIVQLWFCGPNLVQLWSQDIKSLKSGQSFSVTISNNSDDENITIGKSNSNSYLQIVGSNLLQPNNRDNSMYTKAAHSPRMVRITG